MRYSRDFRKTRRRRRNPEVPPEVLETWTLDDILNYERAKRLKLPVASMGFPVRITNTLEDMGLLSLGDLLGLTESDLLRGGNLGVKTLNEIQCALKKFGFLPLSKGEPIPKKELVRGTSKCRQRKRRKQNTRKGSKP